MTDKQIIIDGTKCKYAHFDGGNTQRLLCAIDDCFCDCYRENECYYKQLKRKEQECERLKEERDTWHYQWEKRYEICESLSDDIDKLCEQLDQLKAEVKSKTEYIQEQREIIDQYSKEIGMYKKCQGTRASKREEELKAENKHLNDLLNQALKELEQSREVIEKIKEMCSSVENIENANTLYESKLSGIYLQARKILQICDEVNE